jgi:hypothetical protein
MRRSERLVAERPAAGSLKRNALLQLNILQTVVFSDHTFIHRRSQERGGHSSVPRRTYAGSYQQPVTGFQ